MSDYKGDSYFSPEEILNRQNAKLAAQVERYFELHTQLAARIAELEAENKLLRDDALRLLREENARLRARAGSAGFNPDDSTVDYSDMILATKIDEPRDK